MKTFFLCLFLAIGFYPRAQLKEQLIQIRDQIGINSHQIMKLVQIDTLYLQEMSSAKEEAETDYNPPAAIQRQHKYRLMRRLKAYEAALTPEQYEKIKILRFDIYPQKEWLAVFYRKHKLPTIEEAVTKLMDESKNKLQQ